MNQIDQRNIRRKGVLKRKKVISIFLLLGIIVSQVSNVQIIAAKKKRLRSTVWIIMPYRVKNNIPYGM